MQLGKPLAVISTSLLFLLPLFPPLAISGPYGAPFPIGQVNDSKQQLSLSQIENLIINKTPDKTISIEINRRRISFQITQRDLERLRSLGAGPKTLKALRKETRESENNGSLTTKNRVPSAQVSLPKNKINFDDRNKDIIVEASVFSGTTAIPYSRVVRRSGYFTGRGYFTSVLVEALTGADANIDGEITLNAFIDYVEKAFPELIRSDLGPTTVTKPFAVCQGYKSGDLVISVTSPLDMANRNHKRYALIISVERYEHLTAASLAGADNDVKVLADTLVQHAGLSEDRITVLATDQPPEQQPTRSNIEHILKHIKYIIPKDAMLFVAFIGHAVETERGEAFLLPSDAASPDEEGIENTYISFEWMKNEIRSMKLKQVLMFFDIAPRSLNVSR
jgi:hypothetical protein